MYFDPVECKLEDLFLSKIVEALLQYRWVFKLHRILIIILRFITFNYCCSLTSSYFVTTFNFLCFLRWFLVHGFHLHKIDFNIFSSQLGGVTACPCRIVNLTGTSALRLETIDKTCLIQLPRGNILRTWNAINDFGLRWTTCLGDHGTIVGFRQCLGDGFWRCFGDRFWQCFGDRFWQCIRGGSVDNRL